MATAPHTTSTRRAAPDRAAPPDSRRRVGRFLLDVFGQIGRQPSILDPWMLMAPHYPSAAGRDAAPRTGRAVRDG